MKDLLSAAVEHAGGSLVSWRLDHVDANPRHSTTATYSAAVDWPSGRRTELLGASARAGGRSSSDERAMIFGDGDREVAVWLYPDDPDLPGLRRAAVPDGLAGLLNEHRVLDHPVTDEHVALEMISYRPRRRAVLKAVIKTSSGPRTFFVKVLRESVYAPTLQRHELLRRARFPAAVVAAATADFILVFHEVPGRPLVKAIFDEAMPCTAESMIMLLDALPPAVASLPRRPPWTGAVATYAEMIAAALPVLDPQLRWLVAQVSGGLAGLPPGVEATHGDFHEGQLFVSKGRDHRSARYRHDRTGPAGGRPCLHDRASVDDAADDRRAGCQLDTIDQSLAAGLRHPGGSGRAPAARCGCHCLACDGALSGPGTKLGVRDRTHDRVGGQSGSERGAGLT